MPSRRASSPRPPERPRSRTLADASRLEDVPEAYHPVVEPEAVERFALATECEQSRWRWWRGDPVDFVHRSGALQLFLLTPAVPRPSATPTSSAPTSAGSAPSTAPVLGDDDALQQRMESRFAELRASRTPPLGPPTREELLAPIPAAP